MVVNLPYPVEPQSLQVLGADSIYDQVSNAIYSTVTGVVTWSGTTSTGIGAIAGGNVVAIYGSQVIALPD